MKQLIACPKRLAFDGTDFDQTARRRKPSASKLAISSERFKPFFFASASVSFKSPPSSEMLIFVAPFPILGRPRRRPRSSIRSERDIGRPFSNAYGRSNSLVASASSAALISSGCFVVLFIVFSCEISVFHPRSMAGCARRRSRLAQRPTEHRSPAHTARQEAAPQPAACSRQPFAGTALANFRRCIPLHMATCRARQCARCFCRSRQISPREYLTTKFESMSIRQLRITSDSGLEKLFPRNISNRPFHRTARRRVALLRNPPRPKT
jgi:hypothetical protein